MDSLPDDILSALVVRGSANRLNGFPGLVCQRWLTLCKILHLKPMPILAVTMTKSNSVALLDINTGSVMHEWPALPTIRKGGQQPQWRERARTNWTTGIACGTDLSLFVSQYRVHGILKFVPQAICQRARSTRASVPYKYQRTLRTSEAPEGIVAANHGSVYAVDGAQSCVRRLSCEGALIESMPIIGEFDSLWGVCLARDHYGLLIAGARGGRFQGGGAV